MNRLPRHQPLLCALLCFVLLNAFAFSLHQGQMSGLGLSLSGGSYCSLLGNAPGPQDPVDGDAHPLLSKPCPLCSAGHLAVHGGWGLALRVAPLADVPSLGVVRPAASLERWPTANPRASPRYA